MNQQTPLRIARGALIVSAFVFVVTFALSLLHVIGQEDAVALSAYGAMLAVLVAAVCFIIQILIWAFDWLRPQP